jgi:hypothetical protein
VPAGPLLWGQMAGVLWRAVENAMHQGPGSGSATLRSRIGRGCLVQAVRLMLSGQSKAHAAQAERTGP